VNREQKLSLIIGFTLILLVGVLISDHLSGARSATVSGVDGEETGLFDVRLASGGAEDVAPFPIEDDETTLEPSPASPSLPPVADPLASEGTEVEDPAPFAVIDQSSDLLSELASRGERLLDQGATLLLEMPDRSIPLVKTSPGQTALRWHTVADDETLWEIAERYYDRGSLWEKLARFNAERIGDAHTVRVGVRLAIPDPSVLRDDGATAPSPPAPAAREQVVAERTYTVRKNDTIGEIAQALLGSSKRWREIAELNSIEDENLLFEGQRLVIPAR